MENSTNKIKGYKGFDKDLKCLDKQYAVGETAELEPGKKLKCCPDDTDTEGGLHFCENPLDVLSYYDPASSRYCEVEGNGDIDKRGDDTKVAVSKLHISAEISLKRLLQAGVKFILDRVKWEESKQSNTGYQSAATNTGYQSAATNTGDQSAATNTGDRSAATNTGDQSAATNTGYQSAATNTGDRSAATNTGYQSAATNTGDRSAATNTGDQSAATNTGDQSAATNTGYQSAATNTGDRSAATNTGDQSAATVEGKESVAISLGIEGKAKGKKGCFIVLAEWTQDKKKEYHRTNVLSAVVDGDTIKEDVFYILKDGNFIEAN